MKKNEIKEIEKEIDEKTKMPQNMKERTKKEVFTNIVVAVVIVLYLIFIVLGSIGTIKNVRVIDLNIFSMIYLIIAIVLFEIAYRKDSGSLAMYGIESLAVAIFTLFLPYIIFELDETHRRYYLIASVYVAAYYILKSIYISGRTKAKYMNSISDVKEIVKKEEPKVIDEDIDEIYVQKNEKEKPTKKLKEKKKSNKTKKTDTKKVEQKKIEPKVENKPKKRGRPKKTEIVETNKEEKTTPKKRGRPKKVNTETKAVDNKAENTEAPKRKRGRPRKVAESKW